jgi:RHS repeat-associated protein
MLAALRECLGVSTIQHEYGPFGEVIRATGPMAKANPFRFSTKFQDDESDLVYYGYRYLNTGTGRWVSRDPINEVGFHFLATGQHVSLPKTSDDPLSTALDDDGGEDDLASTNAFLAGQGGLNAYGFNGNDAIIFFDYEGLAPFCICIRASDEHAWIQVTDLADGTVHTYGRYKARYGHPPVDHSGVIVDWDLHRRYKVERCKQVASFTPTINAGYNWRNNNCTTYAAGEWKRVTGEKLAVRRWLSWYHWYYDSPEILEESIIKANGGQPKSSNCDCPKAPTKPK